MTRPTESGEAWSKRTGRFATAEGRPRRGLFRELVDFLPLATMVLDRFGIVAAANRAGCELLQVREEDCIGEPLLAWIGRSGEREAFGRAFMNLRDREEGTTFALDLTLVPALGPAARCMLQATRMSDGHVAVTCRSADVGHTGPEEELGLVIARSLDALDQGVLMIDGEGRVVHANPAGAKLLGEGVVGRSFLELANPTSVDVLSRALALGRAGSWHGEVDMRRVDGEPLAVELSLAVGAGDRAPGVVLVRDVRERRRRAFEDRLVAQIDRCLAASAEPRAAVMAACAALANALGAGRVAVVVPVGGGWERWEVRGEEPSPIVKLADPIMPPEWIAGHDVKIVHGADATIDAVFGRVADHEGGARIVLRSASGVVGHLLLVRRDPDAWDARDRELMGLLAGQIALGLANGMLTLETRALAAYQAMVLDQTTVLLDSVDADGRIVTWNRASEQLVGIGVADALGRRFGVEVARAANPHRWAQLWAELLEEGVVAREIAVLSHDGREIPLHLEGRLLRHGGEIRGAVLVGLDLRERRTLERQILRSQKLAAVGLLAAGIAHEINNPLSGVVGYSSLLLERDLAPDIRAKVEKIARSGERCRKIVEGVLLFSRQQDGGTRRDIDLGKLMDRVIAIGEYQWRMHNIRIIREVEDGVRVMADADQIEQVMLNLLSNAVDAMPRGGTIRLGLRRSEDGSACISVVDQGEGIPEDIQARIFDPFFSTKEIGKGTGLGLAISYGIVQDHGGDILVESSPQGSVFTVILPAGGEIRAADPPEADAATDSPPPQHEPPRAR